MKGMEPSGVSVDWGPDFLLCNGQKFISGSAAEFLARLQDRLRKFFLVVAIGVMLGFEAESVVLIVDSALLALDGAIKEIARVKL